MGSSIQFPTPLPQGGGGGFRQPGAGGMQRPPSPGGAGAVCPTCGMPSMGGGAQIGADMGMPPQSGGPDAAWQARGGPRPRRPAPGRAGGNMPQAMPPPMPKPGGMPFPGAPRPGVTDMPGRPGGNMPQLPGPRDPNENMFGGSFRNFGG